MVIASVAELSSANQGSEPCGPPHRCSVIFRSRNSFASASYALCRERCVAGRDANRHVGGLSRFSEPCANWCSLFLAAKPPTCHPVSRPGSAKEATWVKVIVDEHVAPRIRIWQNLTSRLGSAHMKPLRTALKLPRYCRRKPLKNGRWAYFFEPATWERKQGCPFGAEPLGQNYDAAVTRAESVLLPAFDSWRTRGLSDGAHIGIAKGSFDWLVREFKKQQKWKDVDPHTQRTYEQGTRLFADHILKDGSRAGSKQVGDFTKAFVDAVYAKLLVVESIDAEGNVIHRERRRMAIAAMGACRRAWFVMHRAEEAIVPADNPFAKMGLKKLAPGQKKPETPTATWDELVAFRNAALALGYPSIATAVLTGWERLQREEHLFGAFEISHYWSRRLAVSHFGEITDTAARVFRSHG